MNPETASTPPPLPTPTPRTDAECMRWFRGNDETIVVPADFARGLERELSDAKALFRDQAKHLHYELLSEKRELVEALKEALHLTSLSNSEWTPACGIKVEGLYALLTRLSAKGGTV